MTVQDSDAGERTLASDIVACARFGATPDGGVTRLAWTPELAAATAWVAEELERLGLDASTDPAGNLIGKWLPTGGSVAPNGSASGSAPPATGPIPTGPVPAGAVMVASHLDTVPNGGAYDGTLGVLCAVEAIRLLRRDGFVPARPVWVGAYMDEEGARFGSALFGSRAFCGGDMTPALTLEDRDGRTLREAIRAYGLDPDRVGDAHAVDELAAYLELHIEQGPVLWREGHRLGLVESIAGVLGFLVTVEGEANHAGTTPMEQRRDALACAGRIGLALRDEARATDALRATVGSIRAWPGAMNVIPGRCTFTVDLRISRPNAFADRQAWLRELVGRIAAEEKLTATVERSYSFDPVELDAGVTAALEEAARGEGVAPHRMVSGAGHDAMVVAQRVPAGMVFVPSRDGVSHSPREWTATEDCELGARVLARAIRALAA